MLFGILSLQKKNIVVEHLKKDWINDLQSFLRSSSVCFLRNEIITIILSRRDVNGDDLRPCFFGKALLT